MKWIPYGHQHISQKDLEAVQRILKSDLITQGPAVPKFEEAVAHRVGAAYAVAVNSATSALHIACLALGLGEGGRLWTVANTFVASANCGLYCGARVDFVDIDMQTWNISVEDLESRLQKAETGQELPDVVVTVAFAGQPTLQQKIHELSCQYGFKVIEDAAHAIGASNNGEPLGSCRWSDITIFSFHPVKIITTIEGGMALTNNPEHAEKMKLLRSHGITREQSQLDRKDPPPWYYEQQMLGFNYRMTDVQATLGISQLKQLDGFLERRKQKADIYQSAFAGLPVQLPHVHDLMTSAWHLYVILLDETQAGETHRQIFEALRAKGIGVNLHYMPVYLQPYYRRFGFSDEYCRNAENYAQRAISLPLYPDLSPDDQTYVINALSELMDA